MSDPILVVDTWEEGGEIDEQILLKNGVQGIIVRMNDINGGHHIDSNFYAQWKQAKAFPVRLVYFVYNPWESAEENYRWLLENMPKECGAILLDIEVKYLKISKDEYAKDVQTFCDLVERKWNYMIYTGEWFLENLSSWPIAQYWWAQYPYKFYPSTKTRMSWQDFKYHLSTVSPLRPRNEDKCRGSVQLWQITGDRLILDGCSSPLDVSLYFNSLDDLIKFTNENRKIPPTSAGDTQVTETKYIEGLIENDYTKITEHGTVTYHVTQVEIDRVKEFFVSPRPLSRGYVPNFSKKYNLDLAINGDGFKSIIIAGYASSDGKPYGKLGNEGALYISKNNLISQVRQYPVWTAISYPNELVHDGKISKINKDPNDIRARSAFGYAKDQKYAYFVNVDGADYWVKSGMSFFEVAQLLIDLGCDVGVMLDGGGSTTKAVYDGQNVKVIGIPYGEDFVKEYGLNMRRVANVLGVRMKG